MNSESARTIADCHGGNHGAKQVKALQRKAIYEMDFSLL